MKKTRGQKSRGMDGMDWLVPPNLPKAGHGVDVANFDVS
jgi:hypothetical protein